jgi:hypothetical protein
MGCSLFLGITSENSAHPDIKFVSVNAHAGIFAAKHNSGIFLIVNVLAPTENRE